MRFFDKYIQEKHLHRISPTLLWEYDYDNFKWNAWRKIVVERVIQMGRINDWYAAFDLYGGIEGFRAIARDEVEDLDDRSFEFMCLALNLKKKETLCYRSKQLRRLHSIS